MAVADTGPADPRPCRRNTEFGSQFLHLFRAKRLLDLLAGDREIGAGRYPRLGLLAKAGLLEFGDDALDAAMFVDIALTRDNASAPMTPLEFHLIDPYRPPAKNRYARVCTARHKAGPLRRLVKVQAKPHYSIVDSYQSAKSQTVVMALSYDLVI